jgi:UDP-glucose 4-epimerase
MPRRSLLLAGCTTWCRLGVPAGGACACAPGQRFLALAQHSAGVSEEFLGNAEHDGNSTEPIDYLTEEPFASFERARLAGDFRTSVVALVLEPLTLWVEFLTVAVIEAPAFDAFVRPDGVDKRGRRGERGGRPTDGRNPVHVRAPGADTLRAAVADLASVHRARVAAPARAARPVRVLVTGATGFVGYAVAHQLSRAGHDVRALARSSRQLPDRVQRVAGDLYDPASVHAALTGGTDAVCHLAALARVRDSRADPVGYWRTNVGGTPALLEALIAQPWLPSRLIVASTCTVYGEDAVQPIAESALPRPTSPYGSSKLAADQAVADVAATGAIGAVSLRAFNIAGGLPGHPDRDESRLIPKLVAVAQGRATELTVNGDGSVVRDYVHVADMAEAFLCALDSCQAGRWVAYNVGSGRRSTIADVIAAVEAAVGRRLPVVHRPPAPEPATLLADATRIRDDLGWEPKRSELVRIVGDAQAAYSSEE